MKKSIIYIILIIALLVGMNFLYRVFFWEKDLQEHSPDINLIREAIEKQPEILYLGESSNLTTHSDDKDKRKISDFIADYFPEKKMTDITKPASHAESYYIYLTNIPKDSDIETVIVTLNLRSFDAEWIYSLLETSIQKSLVMLKPYPPLVNRFLLSFKAYDIKTDDERKKQMKDYFRHHHLHFPYSFPYKTVQEWESTAYRNGIYNENGERDETLSILTASYIKTYGFHIDENKNPRIKQFDQIVKLAQKRNWNLVFNLLPENVERAEELAGADLTYLMSENRNFLVERYSKMGVLVVDNLELVENSQFIDQSWTTEHYAEKGRKIVAARVAQSLKNIYPDDYKEIRCDTTLHSVFISDCEERPL